MDNVYSFLLARHYLYKKFSVKFILIIKLIKFKLKFLIYIKLGKLKYITSLSFFFLLEEEEKKIDANYLNFKSIKNL